MNELQRYAYEHPLTRGPGVLDAGHFRALYRQRPLYSIDVLIALSFNK